MVLLLRVADCDGCCPGAEKQRDWQTGKVLDTDQSRIYLGTTYAPREIDVIEGDQYVYVVSRVLRWRWSKTANLTVNAPIQFAVERRSMYVLDDDGKEHKTRIAKRILKT